MKEENKNKNNKIIEGHILHKQERSLQK